MLVHSEIIEKRGRKFRLKIELDEQYDLFVTEIYELKMDYAFLVFFTRERSKLIYKTKVSSEKTDNVRMIAGGKQYISNHVSPQSSVDSIVDTDLFVNGKIKNEDLDNKFKAMILLLKQKNIIENESEFNDMLDSIEVIDKLSK
jgi:hypothetical protein